MLKTSEKLCIDETVCIITYLVLWCESLVDILIHKWGFPYPWVSKYNNFEQNFFPRRHFWNLYSEKNGVIKLNPSPVQISRQTQKHLGRIMGHFSFHVTHAEGQTMFFSGFSNVFKMCEKIWTQAKFIFCFMFVCAESDSRKTLSLLIQLCRHCGQSRVRAKLGAKFDFPRYTS